LRADKVTQPIGLYIVEPYDPGEINDSQREELGGAWRECDDRCANEQRDHHQSAGDALDRAHYRDLFHGKGKSKDNSTVEIMLHRSKIFIVI
jgi:hypothetical protein